MGILDDAIREHLDLKRRAGADPGEISRLEREAFGAGETPPAAEADASADLPEPAAEGEASVAVEPYEPEPVLPPPAAEPEPVVAESTPPPAPPPALEEEELDQPTRQFTAQEVQEAEQRPPVSAPEPEPVPESPAPPEGEHDELEDTPDFLQETPEHDRLWFEQKPPKDFDF